MAASSRLSWPLAAVLLVCVIGAGQAFPFRDNCRRDAGMSRWQIKLVSQRVDPKDGSEFCFSLSLKDANQCNAKGTRCCNTNFAKLKLYINPACGRQAFGLLHLRNTRTGFDKLSSPSMDNNQSNETLSLKYTRWDPQISMSAFSGTTLCMRMRPASKGNKCHTLASISNPKAAANGVFMMALYDRKQRDYTGGPDYECCPTYSIPVKSSSPPKSPSPPPRPPPKRPPSPPPRPPPKRPPSPPPRPPPKRPPSPPPRPPPKHPPSPPPRPPPKPRSPPPRPPVSSTKRSPPPPVHCHLQHNDK